MVPPKDDEQEEVLASDTVGAASYAGCLSQGIPRIFTLAGTLKSNGYLLVQAIVANPRAGAAGDPYQMTVPPRYLELGQMREALSISGKYDEATMAARHAHLKSFFPDIGDGNWRAMSKQMASQPIFAEFTRSRRLQEEEAAEGDNITCPLHMMQWSDTMEGPVPYNPWAEGGADQQYFIRGPYNPDCVWSRLADNTVIKQGGANLLSLLDLGNVMRTMNRPDQDRFKLQMFRVLATG
jgi:hypothetical protein